MEDLLEQANEIQESLGRSYAVPDEIDEADLEAGKSVPFPVKVASTKSTSELDALALDEEEEGTSYLADLNKVPDFVDEPPVELGEVCVPPSVRLHLTNDHFRAQRNMRQSRRQVNPPIHVILEVVLWRPYYDRPRTFYCINYPNNCRDDWS